MNTGTYSASISNTAIIGAPGFGPQWLRFSIYLYPTAAAALSTVVLNVRWHDGTSAKAESLILPLSSLVGLVSTEFIVKQDASHDITWDSVLVGAGQYGIDWTAQNV